MNIKVSKNGITNYRGNLLKKTKIIKKNEPVLKEIKKTDANELEKDFKNLNISGGSVDEKN